MQIDYPRAPGGPDQLPIRQRIFDKVWMELRANGTLGGLADPETMHGKIARRVMHYEIGRQVIRYAHSHEMTDGEITKAVVERMSITYGFEPRVRSQCRQASAWTGIR